MVAPLRHIPALGDLDADEAAEIHALTVQAIAALDGRLRPGGLQRRLEPRRRRRRIDRGAPARARRAALGRRHELHAGARRRQGAARAPRGDASAARRGLGVIRELAENPNVHQPHRRGPRARHRPGRTVRRLPRHRDRAAQRHRAARAARRRTRSRPRSTRSARCSAARGRGGAEWELGESCTPADLVERLARARHPPGRGRARRDRDGADERRARCARAAGTSARRVASVDELVTARRIQHEAFGGNADEVGLEQAEADFATRGQRSARRSSPSSTASRSRRATPPTRRSACSSSAARRCRRPAAAAPTARSSRPGPARRRSAARPSLVTHAGQMSRPILERLGFTPVSRIDRLLDVFPA